MGGYEILAKLVAPEAAKRFVIIIYIAHNGMNMQGWVRMFAGKKRDIMPPTLLTVAAVYYDVCLKTNF